jgi:hypothetical protein
MNRAPEDRFSKTGHRLGDVAEEVNNVAGRLGSVSLLSDEREAKVRSTRKQPNSRLYGPDDSPWLIFFVSGVGIKHQLTDECFADGLAYTSMICEAVAIKLEAELWKRRPSSKSPSITTCVFRSTSPELSAGSGGREQLSYSSTSSHPPTFKLETMCAKAISRSRTCTSTRRVCIRSNSASGRGSEPISWARTSRAGPRKGSRKRVLGRANTVSYRSGKSGPVTSLGQKPLASSLPRACQFECLAH